MGQNRHNQSRLFQRGEWWYYRLCIPSGLTPHPKSRRLQLQVKVSLRSRRYDSAKRLGTLLDYKLEGFLYALSEKRRKNGTMTPNQLRKIVTEFFQRTLDENEQAPIYLAPEDEDGEYGIDPKEGLELHLVELKEALMRRNYGVVEHIVDDLMTTHRIPEEDRRSLSREVLQEAIRTTESITERTATTHIPDSRAISDAVPESRRAKGSRSLHKGQPGLLLSDLIQRYSQECIDGKKWSAKTRAEHEAIYSLFLEIVGDRGVETLTRDVLTDYRGVLLRFPSRRNTNRAMRGMSIEELCQLSNTPKLSVRSVNKKLSTVGSLLRWATRNGMIASNPVEGLMVSLKSRKVSDERVGYDRNDIRALLTSPVYSKPDSKRPERFWLPLILLFSGMRLSEAAQLYVEDVREVGGVLCFDINDQKDKKLKTSSSARIVPVHPTLVELGFVEYVEGVKAEGHPRLWMKLKAKRDGYGHTFGTWYGRFSRQHITTDPRKVLHSLRHTVTESLLNAGVEPELVSAILGHTSKSISVRVYGGFGPKVKLEGLQQLDYNLKRELKKLKWPAS